MLFWAFMKTWLDYVWFPIPYANEFQYVDHQPGLTSSPSDRDVT